MLMWHEWINICICFVCWKCCYFVVEDDCHSDIGFDTLTSSHKLNSNIIQNHPIISGIDVRCLPGVSIFCSKKYGTDFVWEKGFEGLSLNVLSGVATFRSNCTSNCTREKKNWEKASKNSTNLNEILKYSLTHKKKPYISRVWTQKFFFFKIHGYQNKKKKERYLFFDFLFIFNSSRPKPIGKMPRLWKTAKFWQIFWQKNLVLAKIWSAFWQNFCSFLQKFCKKKNGNFESPVNHGHERYSTRTWGKSFWGQKQNKYFGNFLCLRFVHLVFFALLCKILANFFAGIQQKFFGKFFQKECVTKHWCKHCLIT